MKKITLMIAYLAISLNSNAQTSLKVYNEFLVERKTNYQFYDSSIHKTFKDYSIHTSVLQPTFAIQWKAKRKKNFHQIEVNRFKIKLDENHQEYSDSIHTNVVGGHKNHHINIAIRYEYLKHIVSDKFAKHQFYIGFGVNPFFDREQLNPMLSNQYPVTFSSIGLSLFATPRYVFHINKRFYTDFNLPINVANLYYDFSNIYYTNMNGKKINNSNTVNFDAFPKYVSARIGLGISL